MEWILNWPVDKLDDKQKENLTRLQHHFVGRSDDSADHDSSDATPLRQLETPTTTDSPSGDNSNSFNKAILAMTILELDSSFQELVENGFNQDQLQDVLKKDSPRSVSKLAKGQSLLSQSNFKTVSGLTSFNLSLPTDETPFPQPSLSNSKPPKANHY